MKILINALAIASLLCGSAWAGSYMDNVHQFSLQKPEGWREISSKDGIVFSMSESAYNHEMKIVMIPVTGFEKMRMGYFSEKFTNYLYKGSGRMQTYKSVISRKRGVEFWELKFKRSSNMNLIYNIWAWNINGTYYVLTGMSHIRDQSKISVAMYNMWDRFASTVQARNNVHGKSEMAGRSSGRSHYVNSTEFRLGR